MPLVQDQCICRPSHERIDVDHFIAALGVGKTGPMGTACGRKTVTYIKSIVSVRGYHQPKLYRKTSCQNLPHPESCSVR